MIWNREEEGEPVEVRLNRIDKLPRTYGDQVLGLWKLESKQGEGPIYKDENKDDFLFLRWDKRFVARNNGKRLSGIYNVHGHRAELEMIPYGKDYERSFWRLELEEQAIKMQLLNSDSTVIRQFSRIRNFPQ